MVTRLRVNDVAKGFSLDDQNGEEFRLSDFKGK